MALRDHVQSTESLHPLLSYTVKLIIRLTISASRGLLAAARFLVVNDVCSDNRVINRAPGLKLVVQTLLHSLRPIGNIVLICCMFFIVFGILGVQVFSSLSVPVRYKHALLSDQ